VSNTKTYFYDAISQSRLNVTCSGNVRYSISKCVVLQILQISFNNLRKICSFLKHGKLILYTIIVFLYSVLCNWNIQLNGVNTLVFL
jgi:hypothetical protein